MYVYNYVNLYIYIANPVQERETLCADSFFSWPENDFKMLNYHLKSKIIYCTVTPNLTGKKHTLNTATIHCFMLSLIQDAIIMFMAIGFKPTSEINDK